MNNDWVVLDTPDMLLDWNEVQNLSISEFNKYLSTLSSDMQLEASQLETKRQGIQILKTLMKTHSTFYSFIKDFSPVDYKNIKGIPHVSKRVIGCHFNMWNAIHPNRSIKKLNTFDF